MHCIIEHHTERTGVYLAPHRRVRPQKLNLLRGEDSEAEMLCLVVDKSAYWGETEVLLHHSGEVGQRGPTLHVNISAGVAAEDLDCCCHSILNFKSTPTAKITKFLRNEKFFIMFVGWWDRGILFFYQAGEQNVEEKRIIA